MTTARAVLAALGRRLEHGAPPAPHPAGVPRAAVAIVMREVPAGQDTELELLLIKRAERHDDPWSGHIALPGGRESPSDPSLEATALRETLEETGIDLARDGRLLGALGDLDSRAVPVPVVVRPFVATVRPDVRLVLSDEVATAFWMPLASLTAPGAIVDSVVQVRGTTRHVPSFRYREYVVWGMTQRILYEFLQLLEVPTGP